MTLRGPADAEQFRVQVGRYKERWYHDPLPACDIAPASTDSWPSVTTIKNAWPKFLGPWMANEAARYAVEQQPAWENLDPKSAMSVIAKASDRSRDKSADRGTLVHAAMEEIIVGATPDPIMFPGVERWVEAGVAFAADLSPTLVLKEAVAFSRTFGYAGTLDAVIEIDGRNYIVDYKSRAEGKGDVAYDDEGVQLGAYAGADYVIVDDGTGRAVRSLLPPLDGGLIITIAPDGYKLFPVDLAAAMHGAQVMRSFWAVQTAKDIVGKPVHLTAGSNAATALRLERRASLVACIEAIREAGHLNDLAAVWPEGVPTFKRQKQHTDAQLDAIYDAVWDIGARFELPFFLPDPATVQEPRPTDADVIGFQRVRKEFGDDVLFCGLVSLASLGEGRKLSEFSVADGLRLSTLVRAIDKGTITVSLDADTAAPVVATTFDLIGYLQSHNSDRIAALDHARLTAAQIGTRPPDSLIEAAADPLLVAALTAA